MNATQRQILCDNVAQVQANIVAACQRTGRNPADVRLVAVTKYVDLDVVRELVAAGVADLGESRVQQLVARAHACGTGPCWHMLGHVQRNKIKSLLPYARILHALDSVRLAEALSQQAQELQVAVDVFIEVNVAGEAAKTGAAPGDVAALAAAAANLPLLRLRGLMAMAPYDTDPETSRPYFVKLRELLGHLRKAGLVGPDCRDLSMGMSQDYVVAVEEGATLVRVGSALFAGLATADPRQV